MTTNQPTSEDPSAGAESVSPRSHDAPAADADPAALEHIVDDVPPMEPFVEWAANEMVAGRSLASILPELKQSGWSDAEAEEIAEQARLATRHLRGGVTRNRIARENEREYRASLGRAMAMGILGGLGFVVGIAGSALFTLFRSLRKPPVTRRVEAGIDDLPAESVAERLKRDNEGAPE